MNEVREREKLTGQAVWITCVRWEMVLGAIEGEGEDRSQGKG